MLARFGYHRPMETWADRFWEKVDKSGECWVWMGTCDSCPSNYGRFRLGKKKERAHRVSWMLSFGSIPEGMWVLHHCDNPPCVRPEHLFLGTNSINQKDAVRKGRQHGPRRGQAARGEMSGSARLTEDDIRLIRISPESQRELGRRFGVSGVAIHKIRTRKTWSHVE